MFHKLFNDKLEHVHILIQALIEEMPMRLSALESVQAAAEELIKQAGNSQDEAVKG